VFQVAVEDRDMAKILDTDGNAFLGFTASTGSRGFALPVRAKGGRRAQGVEALVWALLTRGAGI
jgi:hypothetical protein